SMRVAVVGAGPGGALLAYHLAQDGADVTVFDSSHPREKPCGGGVTARALDLLPPAPAGDPLPARLVTTARFESQMGHGVEAPLAVRFVTDLSGYLWLFPRPDHVGVGICAPLAAVPTRRMLDRLEHEVAVSFPALLDDEAPRYAHTIPSPSADPRSILEVAGA